MEVVNGLPQVMDPSAVALGYFDGVHLAHQQVIRSAVNQKAAGLIPTVMCFRTSLRRPENKDTGRLILTEEQKLEQFARLGIERVFLPDFAEIADMTAAHFLQEILQKRLSAAAISCGYDYSFGQGGRGDVSLLRRFCHEKGLGLEVLQPVLLHGETVSSTAIRQALLEGDIPRANELLGYDYYILGEVVHGRSLGRTLGFPTLNQPFGEDQLVPRYGVYNSRTKIGGSDYRSITNVGIKPTISGLRAPLAETHLLGGQGDWYGKVARVSLLEMTRPEKKFSGVEELKQVVLADIARREQRSE